MNTWEFNIRNWYPEEGETLIGNGFLGGSLPRDGHGATGNPYAATVVGLYTGEDEQPATVPHWLNAPLFVNGQPVRLSWVGFQQKLDLRSGTFSTSYFDHTRSVRVNVETFVHRGERAICAYRIRVEALTDLSISVTPQLDAGPCRPIPRVSIKSGADTALDRWHLHFGNDAGDAEVAQAIIVQADTGIHAKSLSAKKNSIGSTISAELHRGDKLGIDVTILTFTGPAAEHSLQGMLQTEAFTFDQLRSTHVTAMKDTWGTFDVDCDDPFLARRAKASMFYLLCGYREDVIHGGSAGGVSSKGAWGGSVFWDTEFYMFPPLLIFSPTLARNTLLYREATLPAARANAKEHGEEGARFAWQSKRTGKPLAGPFEDERHISTDIAFCASWYSQASGDDDFLVRTARELIREVAQNVASRCIHNPAANRYEIHGVIPPDEHVMDHYVGHRISNSVMTNAYAQWVLNKACDLGLAANEAQSLKWRAMASQMFLPRDEQNDIYAEYEGYDGHPIKQADVGHLFFPLDTPASPEEIQRTIKFYADRERETGLFLLHSPCVYAAAMNRAGDSVGVGIFSEMTNRFSIGPFDVPRESNYGGPPVITGAGSFLIVIAFGMLGLDTFGKELKAHPCLPPQVMRLCVSGIHFGNERYSVSAERSPEGGSLCTIQEESNE